MESTTLLVCGVVAVLMFVRFWRYVISAALLVGCIYLCALIFAGYTPDSGSGSTNNAQCTTPGGIAVQCK